MIKINDINQTHNFGWIKKFVENDEYLPSNSTTPFDYNKSGSKYGESMKIDDFKKCCQYETNKFSSIEKPKELSKQHLKLDLKKLKLKGIQNAFRLNINDKVLTNVSWKDMKSTERSK